MALLGKQYIDTMIALQSLHTLNLTAVSVYSLVKLYEYNKQRQLIIICLIRVVTITLLVIVHGVIIIFIITYCCLIQIFALNQINQ